MRYSGDLPYRPIANQSTPAGSAAARLTDKHHELQAQLVIQRRRDQLFPHSERFAHYEPATGKESGTNPRRIPLAMIVERWKPLFNPLVHHCPGRVDPPAGVPASLAHRARTPNRILPFKQELP